LGRIKTIPIKRTTHVLMDSRPTEFNTDFSHNKKMVATMIEGGSKKMRNVIAGYVTRLAKQRAQGVRVRRAPEPEA
jgi:small subunit ribosomal protein S17e